MEVWRLWFILMTCMRSDSRITFASCISLIIWRPKRIHFNSARKAFPYPKLNIPFTKFPLWFLIIPTQAAWPWTYNPYVFILRNLRGEFDQYMYFRHEFSDRDARGNFISFSIWKVLSMIFEVRCIPNNVSLENTSLLRSFQRDKTQTPKKIDATSSFLCDDCCVPIAFDNYLHFN
jgi:hypothetical protein